MIEYLDGKQFKEMIIAGANKLETKKELVNNLNVFPVPDGDTGTNMSLTLTAALEQLGRIKSNSLKQVADALSNGTLMGARGNSGVILSQIFKGLAKGAGQREKLTAIGLARALDRSVKTLYKSGGFKPVEGTIVTVIREAARAAWETARKTRDILTVWSVMVKAAENTLAETPKMLRVLRDAGVVDAGGQGLVFILQGALEYLEGNISIDLKDEFAGESGLRKSVPSNYIEYQYCTELVIQGEDISLEAIESYLEPQGDSLLVVGDCNTTKVHLHTNHPGLVLEYALQWGSLHNVQISNMVEQYQEKTREENTNKEEKEKEVGVVAVAVGEGIGKLFANLGCDQLVEGGQTMNPSTEDLLKAVKKVTAKKVIILPNNKNIILATRQLSQLCTDKEIGVIPSLSIPQGMAALLTFDPSLSWEQLKEKMEKAIGQVKTVEITHAVRDCIHQGREISAGDILGIWEGEITVVGQLPFQVVQSLLQEKLDGNEEIITIFSGKDINQAETEALAVELSKLYPNLEIELQYGGQPHYYYLISIE